MGSETKRIKLAHINNIPEGKSIVVNAGENEIALYKIQGQIYALNNACPHMGGPLGEGDIENFCVTCPWHGWEFDIKTGTCITMPGEDAERFDIEIINDEIYI